jgi:hypothetical protein
MPKVGNDAQDGAALVTAVGVGSWAVETSAFVNDRSNGDHHKSAPLPFSRGPSVLQENNVTTNYE